MSNGTSTAPAYPITVDAFRLLCPAFADETKYPDAYIQMWLDLAAGWVNCSWGPSQGFGQAMWAAFEMEKMAVAAGAPAGSGGTAPGIVNSKSVGPVSVGYDTQIGTIEGAGIYNENIYGRQYYMMANLFGMGPFQFGPPEPSPVGSPWFGPITYLGYY